MGLETRCRSGSVVSKDQHEHKPEEAQKRNCSLLFIFENIVVKDFIVLHNEVNNFVN